MQHVPTYQYSTRVGLRSCEAIYRYAATFVSLTIPSYVSYILRRSSYVAKQGQFWTTKSGLTSRITALSPTFVEVFHIALEQVFTKLFIYHIVLIAKPHAQIFSSFRLYWTLCQIVLEVLGTICLLIVHWLTAKRKHGKNEINNLL